MSDYISNNLSSGENIRYRTELSSVIFVPFMIGVAAIVLATVFLWFSGFMHNIPFWLPGTIALALMLVFLFMPWLEKKSSEFAITNKRVLMKTGILSRNVFEIRLERIESVNLNQGLLGRMLDFGDVTICGTGQGSKTFSMIPNPSKFKNEVSEAQEMASH